MGEEAEKERLKKTQTGRNLMVKVGGEAEKERFMATRTVYGDTDRLWTSFF